MLPKQINEDIKKLNEKVSELSVKRNSFKTYQKKIFVDEIKESTFSINRMLDNLSDEMSNIILNSPYSNFEVREWFESLKEKVAFSEPNPKILDEKQKREFEQQKIKQAENEFKKTTELYYRRNAEFLSMCYFGPENIGRIKELIKEGLIISNFTQIDSKVLKTMGRSNYFISVLLENGIKK